MNDFTVRCLAEFPARLALHFAAFAHELRDWAPSSWDGVPSEPLTAIAQLCHVLDVEVEGYQVRFRRTLAEHEPHLPGLDTERLARERDYAHADAQSVLARFIDARIATVQLIAGLSSQQLARRAVFEDYGPVSLRSLVHYLCSHDEQHLAGLQWLLGKIAGRVGPA